MKLTATDADEPGTENSQIAYTIIDQTPDDDMFYIGHDGTIFVKNLLDREVWTDTFIVLSVIYNDSNRNKSSNSECTPSISPIPLQCTLSISHLWPLSTFRKQISTLWG